MPRTKNATSPNSNIESKPQANPLPGAESAKTVKSAAERVRVAGNRRPKQLPADQQRRSKADQLIALLRRKSGASLEELRQASGWQPHSVRGFLSGTVRKRCGLALTTEVGTGGARRYRVTDEEPHRR